MPFHYSLDKVIVDTYIFILIKCRWIYRHFINNISFKSFCKISLRELLHTMYMRINEEPSGVSGSFSTIGSHISEIMMANNCFQCVSKNYLNVDQTQK